MLSIDVTLTFYQKPVTYSKSISQIGSYEKINRQKLGEQILKADENINSLFSSIFLTRLVNADIGYSCKFNVLIYPHVVLCHRWRVLTMGLQLRKLDIGTVLV